MSHCRRGWGAALIGLVLLTGSVGRGEEGKDNWPSWRGPSEQGHSADDRVPLAWSDKSNLRWKARLPGKGNSSPIVWGQRIFLTAAGPNGDERYVLCINRADGKVLWQRTASKGVPAGRTHTWNGYASASCVTDGRRVYAFFGTPGLFCYDLDGNLLWKHQFGIFTSSNGWGTAASPFLFDDLIIQNCDNDGAKALPKGSPPESAAPMALVALDKIKGTVVWQVPRNQGRGFSTPRLVSTPRGRLELVLNGPSGVWAYDPRTGKELWHSRRDDAKDQGKFGEPMPVTIRNLLVAFSGRPGPCQAIRLDGTGDVTQTHRVWEFRRKGRDVGSPIIWGDRLYMADNKAVLTCYDLSDGRVIWSQRLAPEAKVLASPVSVRGKLLFLLDTGETVVLEPGPKFQVHARNVLGDNRALDFAASPAVVDGCIFIRSQSFLYCVGTKPDGASGRRHAGVKPQRSRSSRQPALAPPRDPPFYVDKTRLLVYRDEEGKERPVKTAADWARRRAHIVANMELVMGPLPDKSEKVLPDVKYAEQAEKQPGWIRKKLTIAVAKNDRVPGYLFLPANQAGKVPAILCLHQTNGRLGSKEPAGMGGKANLHYALHLAERGYVTLAIDYPSFGDYPYDFKKSSFKSGSMKAVWNNMCAIDFLQSLPEVDAERIGCIGHSLGGHNTMFTAVFDQRIKASVSNCGFNSFPKYYKGNLAGWDQDRYMPRIGSVYGRKPDKMPFDFPEIVAAFAPRAFLASAPVHDDNFEVSGVKDCLTAARPVYELLGAADKLAANYPDCGHDFPPEVRRVAYAWLDRWLKGK
jgi:outer membrane protein assembly factor BamB/acetyl esterase/lipase